MKKYIALLLSLVLLACAGETPRRQTFVTCNDPAPSDDDVELLRWYIQRARRALPSLPPMQRDLLAAHVTRAEQALETLFEALGERSWCTKGKGYLYIAGAAVVADDATGVGAADDVLLPFIAFGAIALHMMTEAPAPPAELAMAWGGVVGTLDSLAREAERLKTSPVLPPMNDCQVHFAECLSSRLQSRRGSTHGSSACIDCNDFCRNQGRWYDFTESGQDCRWWNY